MRIVNVVAGFQNSYNQTHVWQVWDGREFLGAFKTRADAGKFSERRMVEVEARVFKQLEEEKA